MAKCICFILCSHAVAWAEPEPRTFSSEAPYGAWIQEYMVLDGRDYPPRDPRLILKYVFLPTNESVLEWSYDSFKTYCRRWGKFTVDEVSREIHDEVLRIDQGNRGDCSQDPDMQVGRRVKIPFEVRDRCLRLSIPFGEKDLVYVWRPEDQKPPFCPPSPVL